MIENEHNVIGALLLQPYRLDEINLSSDDFTDETGRLVFQAICEMTSAQDVIDPVTVANHLKNNTGQEWLHPIGEIVKVTASAANVKAYATLVRQASNKRKTRAIGLMLQEDPSSVHKAIHDLMALDHDRKNYEYSMPQIIAASVDMIDAAHQSEGITGIATGLIDLDEATGGFQRSDLITLGARPGVGKTALMLNFADRCNVPCGIISAEQGYEQIGARMIAINSRVSVHKMRRGKLSEDDWHTVADGVGEINNRKIWLNDKPAPHIQEIVSQARKWKHQYDIKILFVDYIQRLIGRGDSLRERTGDICKSLKELARELDIPVIALSQLSREVDKRPSKRPIMSDLRESGEIEAESDVIFLLYRDSTQKNHPHQEDVLEIIVGKNRHGPVGTIKTLWNADCMRVGNFAFRL